MKLPDKHKRLGLLMIISQLLLIGFTLYWLTGQYKQEKESLLLELNSSYSDSHQRVLDSLLMKHYINPVLGDTTMPELAFAKYQTGGRGVIMTDSMIYRIKKDHFPDTLQMDKAFVTIRLSDTDSSETKANDLQLLEQEMLLRSVRLIVQHVDDSSSNHFRSFHSFGNNIDTALFISVFEDNIIEEGINVKSIWYDFSDSVSKPGSDKNLIIIGGKGGTQPLVSIKNYRSYLFRQIVPQFLFAFVLILLTASAFVLAYRSIRKQTQLNTMRDSFIGNMSHELKTPVSTVKLAIEAIRNFDLSKDRELAREYLDMASKEIKRLELLITKVLDNTIIEQDKSILHFEHVNLNNIISGAVESLLPKIKDSDAEIRFEPALTISVDADPLYLQGVIINLIDNSLKYGNGHPEIDIKLSSSDKRAIIAITDNGPGIPAQYLGKVFDKFFRIPTQDVHNVKGYGLGLSFASLIVEMHGGSISVQNNNTGCTFSVEIPLNKA
ncbi:MAG: HAMP domain-containing sensor histidine kinase [Bacteroidales bacterium]|nr:HAMP domain-containing sensor histidine kinase [Bacteroidales bacterium]